MPGLLAFTLALNNTQFKQATAASTIEVKKFDESIKQATARLKEEYGMLKSPPKAAGAGGAHDTAPVEHHTQSVRHLRHELGLLSEVAGQFGQEMGGLGRLAGLAFNPYLMAIAAVSIGLNMLIESWKALHEQEVQQLTWLGQFRNAMGEAVASASRGVVTQNIEFATSLAHSADAIDRDTQAMERRIAAFHATVDAQNEVFAAQSRATDAQIEADQAMGRITAQEALRRRQQQDLAVTASGFGAANEAAQNEIAEKEGRLRRAEIKARQAAEAHAAAVAVAETPNAALQSQEEQVRIATQARDEALKQKNEQAAYIRDIEGHHAVPHAEDVFYNPYQKLQDLTQFANSREGDVLGAQRHLDALKQQMIPLQANIEAAKKKADIEQGVLNTYTREIAQQKELLRIAKEKQTNLLLAKAREQEAERQRQIAGQMEAVRSSFGATNFERQGFHFTGSGGPTILADHARATAQATQTSAQLLAQILQALTGAGRPDLANQFANQHP
jgi:hypothetical protein